MKFVLLPPLDVLNGKYKTNTVRVNFSGFNFGVTEHFIFWNKCIIILYHPFSMVFNLEVHGTN